MEEKHAVSGKAQNLHFGLDPRSKIVQKSCFGIWISYPPQKKLTIFEKKEAQNLRNMSEALSLVRERCTTFGKSCATLCT